MNAFEVKQDELNSSLNVSDYLENDFQIGDWNFIWKNRKINQRGELHISSEKVLGSYVTFPVINAIQVIFQLSTNSHSCEVSIGKDNDIVSIIIQWILDEQGPHLIKKDQENSK